MRDISANDTRSAHRTGLAPDQWPIITLSYVRAAWHNIILSDPLLWAVIIDFPPWKLAKIRLHLERSRPCPITIYFRADIKEFDKIDSLGYYDEDIRRNALGMCDVLGEHLKGRSTHDA
jgi:hypothetical protein